MKTISSLLLSAGLLLSPAVTAQQTIQPQPPSYRPEDDPGFKRLSPEAQEWVRDMTRRLHSAVEHKDLNALDQLIWDTTRRQLLGMTLCGHRVDEGTTVDAVALSPASEQAILIRWPDTKGTAVHTAILTGRLRCVVKDGDILERKRIVRVLPNSLGISEQHGLVAFQAVYQPEESGTGIQENNQRAAFIEDRYLADIDPRKASALNAPVREEDRDFWWRHEKEALDFKPGVFIAAIATPAQAGPVQKPEPPAATPPVSNPKPPLVIPSSKTPAPPKDCAEPKPRKRIIGIDPRKLGGDLAKRAGLPIDVGASGGAADKNKTQPCPAAPARSPAAK